MEDTSKDPIYRAYVRRQIEAGLRDSEAGRTTEVNEVRARFGLSSLGSEVIALWRNDISRGDAD